MPNPELQAMPAASAAKRKAAPRDDEGDSDAESDVSMINVDFDFMNLNPDVDQIAIKRLLRQTLSHDDNLVDVHPLADLILAEGKRLKAGSTIKTDGEESDPWGILAAVDINRCRGNTALQGLLAYLLSTNPPAPIKSALEGNGPSTALLFSMRMLNLPVPLIPPLYKMLGTELAESGAEFAQYLLWGRGYKLDGKEAATGLEMDAEQKGNKKQKGGAAGGLAAGSFPYHPEEEMIEARASSVHTYALKTAPPRDDESFGVEQFGRLILIDTPKLAQAVTAMEEACR